MIFTDDDDVEDKGEIVCYMAILQLAIIRVIEIFMRTVYSVRLNLAARYNDLSVFEQCIKQQVIDVDIKNDFGRTALNYAAAHANDEMVAKLLKKKATVTMQAEPNKETALHLAICKRNLAIVGLLLQSVKGENLKIFVDMKTKDKGWTAVHLAAIAGWMDLLKLLLQHCATYDLKDASGKTPLALSENMVVIGFLRGIDHLFKMAKTGNESLVRKLKALQNDELLAAGNARNSSGHTLGKVAELNGHQTIASQVLELLEKVTPTPKKIQESQDFDETVKEMETYQLQQILLNSPF